VLLVILKMERKININPSHLEHLRFPEDTKGNIGIDASDCPTDCASLKINARGEKVCKAIIIYPPKPIAQPKIEPKN